jgi:putative endonuclease
MKFYLYILYSQSKDRYYTGSCSDLAERLKRHNAGATPSTKPGRPWIIVYSEVCETKTEALHREKNLKRMKSRKLIEELIRINESM